MNDRTAIQRGTGAESRSPHQMSVSRETLRRMRIVDATFGTGWQAQHPGASVSAMYRTAVDDTREVVYARVSPDTKDMLWMIAEDWGVTLSEVVEELIRYQCEDES